MFQDNPLLAQLKQQLHSQTPRAEGVVKATEKGFGFLEVDAQKSYFIPPPQMKKVMHGDRIIAVIHSEKERESAEPEELVEPFLTRFVGKVQGKNDRLTIVPDHPLLKDAIPCRAARGLNHEFKEGDWAVAEMRRHPLKGDRSFYAELTQYITFGDDHFVPWWVTLARHNLEKEAPDGVATEMLDEGLVREDLTSLDFVTIDSASTEDMDDALFAKALPDDKLQLIVAIADPTAWIAEGSKLDKAAKIRAFTNYLPGFNIPMLPRELSDDLCSLRANEVRPVLACRMTLSADGTIEDNIEFFAATIESKAKLVYDQVSDWLENTGDWKPESEAIAEQVRLLAQICQRRGEWRHNHALVFKDRPDYRFILGEKGEVLDIVAEPRRIANRIVEEAIGQRLFLFRNKFVHSGSGKNEIFLICSGTDITEERRTQERLRILANTDSITGLPNRNAMQELIDHAINQADNNKVGVVYLDLDNFKKVNDAYGHLFGDQLLRDVSLAILSCLEHDQVLARPGGDEFLVLASNTSQSALEAMASRILTRLRLPFRIGLIEVYTSCSVGISLSPEHGSDSATIIRHADTAMYTAKEGGRGQFCVFTPEMNQRVFEYLWLDTNLRKALENDQLVIENHLAWRSAQSGSTSTLAVT